MTTGRTDLGREVEAALGEVLAHVRGETSLSCRIVDDPRNGNGGGASRTGQLGSC